MFDRLLVPLDGSEPAEAALALATLIPSRRVRLLTVEPDTTGPMLVSAPEWEAWRTSRKRGAQAYLDHVARPLRGQGRMVEPVFAFGDPAEQIIHAAADDTLIVMGSHGRGGGGRVLYGSVADRVARHATVPTLIVRGGAQPAAAPSLTRLVVPLDGSSLAERALPMATALAEVLGLPIHLVRVVDVDLPRATVQAGMPAATAVAGSEDVFSREAEGYLTLEAQRLHGQDLAVTREVRAGAPVGELLATIRSGDVVVLSTHGRGGLRRWLLGSTAEKLVRLASAPVLVMRPEQDANW